MIPLHNSDEIQQRVQAIARQINSDSAGRELDIVYLVNGASVFCADLVRHLTVPVRIHPFGFTSYANPSPSGEVRITLDIVEPLQGRHVLMVEGIVVSGRTPKYVATLLQLRQPISFAICALGVKRKALAVDLPIKYVGFEFGPEIVIGYGVGEGSEKALPHLLPRINSGK